MRRDSARAASTQVRHIRAVKKLSAFLGANRRRAVPCLFAPAKTLTLSEFSGVT